MSALTYVELFAGAGGLSLGLEAAGFHPVAHCEIEPHARAVLRYRWPQVRLDGDVTQVNGADFKGVTLISGGSPCQDLSVAGKRKGLAGERSGLFHQQVRIWQESEAPYLLWENVLGALSSNNGRDFGTVLSTLVGATLPVPSDGWRGGGVAAGPDAVAAWRVLDLQHFGPPQRRVRVFVVAARTGGVDPAEVLALSESVCGHPSPREQQRQSAATGAAGGVGAGGVIPYTASRFAQYEEGIGQLRASGGDLGGGSETILAFHHTQDPISGDVSPAIGRTTEGMGVVAFPIDTRNATRTTDQSEQNRQGVGIGDAGDPSPTLTSLFVPAVIALDGTDTVGSLLARGDSSPCVDRGQPAVVQTLTVGGRDKGAGDSYDNTPITVQAYGNVGMESWKATDVTVTATARDHKSANNVVVGTLDFGGHGGSYNGQDAYQNRHGADSGRPRRLTPLECERLMSWPDQWTATGRKEDGTEYALSDTARYRLCGNGVGSVCVAWFAHRLADFITQQGGRVAA